jgi:hypothetical protein
MMTWKAALPFVIPAAVAGSVMVSGAVQNPVDLTELARRQGQSATSGTPVTVPYAHVKTLDSGPARLWFEPRAWPDTAVTAAETTLLLRADPGDTVLIARVTAVLQNARGLLIPVTVTWGVASTDARATEQLGTRAIKVPVPGALALRVRVATHHGSTPHRGYLLLELRDAQGAKPVLRERELRITGGGGPPAAAHEIMQRSLLIAALLVFAAVLLSIIKKNFNKDPVVPGSPVVEFNQSWASGLALGATLLTTLLPFAVFPDEPRYLTRATYVLLGGLFSSFVATALLLGGTLAPMQSHQGYRRIFVWLTIGLPAMLVLWGTYGQLLTLKALFGELDESHVIPSFTVNWLTTLLYALGGLVALHAIYSIASKLPRGALAEIRPTPVATRDGSPRVESRQSLP